MQQYRTSESASKATGQRYFRERVEITEKINYLLNFSFQKLLDYQEIFESNELFGGCNVILLGDLMQLPPVMAPRVFESLQSNTACFFSVLNGQNDLGRRFARNFACD